MNLEIKSLIGETAGQVWHLLETDGPQTLPQLKRKLDGTAPFLDFAVGVAHSGSEARH